jgi:RNA polymerase sigma-70 factor (ECF subfamily)
MGDDMLSVVRTSQAVPEGDEIDELTLRRAATGERAASRALVERYQVRVFALVSRMLYARAAATIEDVAQDTFLQVFKQLPMFVPAGRGKPDPLHDRPHGTARLSTWILTIAARRAIDELRRERPAAVPHEEPIGGERADERARRREVIVAIEAALAELSPELRAAFLLREYHGLEYAEIALALRIDLGTVKSRLSRARAALRERLAEVHHE